MFLWGLAPIICSLMLMKASASLVALLRWLFVSVGESPSAPLAFLSQDFGTDLMFLGELIKVEWVRLTALVMIGWI